MRRHCLVLVLLAPLFAAECDGEEYTFDNQQFVWVRANATVDPEVITVVRGRIKATAELNGQRLYFVGSACEDFTDWPRNFECAVSRITLFLQEGFEYDIVGWSEPADRRTPDRELTVFRQSWTCCD